jgi:hypothetical protein
MLQPRKPLPRKASALFVACFVLSGLFVSAFAYNIVSNLKPPAAAASASYQPAHAQKPKETASEQTKLMEKLNNAKDKLRHLQTTTNSHNCAFCAYHWFQLKP